MLLHKTTKTNGKEHFTHFTFHADNKSHKSKYKIETIKNHMHTGSSNKQLIKTLYSVSSISSFQLTTPLLIERLLGNIFTVLAHSPKSHGNVPL